MDAYQAEKRRKQHGAESSYTGDMSKQRREESPTKRPDLKQGRREMAGRDPRDTEIARLRGEVAEMRQMIMELRGTLDQRDRDLYRRLKNDVEEAALDQRAKLEVQYRAQEEAILQTAGALADLQVTLGEGRSLTKYARLVPEEFGGDPVPTSKRRGKEEDDDEPLPRSQAVNLVDDDDDSGGVVEIPRPSSNKRSQEEQDALVQQVYLPDPLPVDTAGTYYVLRTGEVNQAQDIRALMGFASRRATTKPYDATHVLINFRAPYEWPQENDEVMFAVVQELAVNFPQLRPIVVVFTDSEGGLPPNHEFRASWAGMVPHLIVAYPFAQHPEGTLVKLKMSIMRNYLKGATSLEEVYRNGFNRLRSRLQY